TRVVREKHPACAALASHRQPQASSFPSLLFSHPALVGMPRVQRLLVLAAALAVAVPVALAARSATITPTSLAGVDTGLTRAADKRALGRPVVTEFLENDYSRLVFARRKVEVYFHGKAGNALVVGTWDRSARTARGVGPCSTVTALKRAYGTQ